MKPVNTSKRLYSLDALRGFDMFWIIGAERIFHTYSEIKPTSFWVGLSNQFIHPTWHGFSFYDLIFPLFLFLAGVATPYSIGKQMEMGRDKMDLLIRIIKRGLILVLLGVVYNNGLELKPIDEIRFGSVLGRIGLAYMFANIIYLFFNQKKQVFWFFGILISYWLLFLFFSAPGYLSGDLSMEGNIVSYLDRIIMPGKLYLGIHDPEGLFSTIPAISTALLGIYTGSLLINTNPLKKKDSIIKMLLISFSFILIAQLWNFIFPINKNLWTSSFVLHCGGLSLLLMSIFYYIIDVLNYKKWAFFFKIIGMNSILIYMSIVFINWNFTTNSLFKWLLDIVGEPFNSVVYVFCLLFVQWIFLFFLYKKKIFLRV
ncbi:MAG: DUF5009 domain-containing protein [Flavobacteriaceae bacterium]|nr:DUF5009 domain-containing protein [Flavobacteriaceae bacterium]|tara:strand:+ start:7089 stop:8201 length:1113 start_codon:yes stop_codon:yes gene_type:complete